MVGVCVDHGVCVVVAPGGLVVGCIYFLRPHWLWLCTCVERGSFAESYVVAKFSASHSIQVCCRLQAYQESVYLLKISVVHTSMNVNCASVYWRSVAANLDGGK